MADDSPPKPAAQAGDPSMEDILASIRRILSEDETGSGSPEPGNRGERADDVFDLDSSMMIPEERPPATMPPARPSPKAVPAVSDPAPPAPVAAAPAAALPAAALPAAPNARGPSQADYRLYEGGPTLESLVRDALRPLLKEWLDAHLPAMVERLYRAQAERVVGRSQH